MRKTFRYLSVMIFVVGTVILANAYINKPGEPPAKANDFEPALSYEITYMRSDLSPDGSLTVTEKRIRSQRADGEWKEVIYGVKITNNSENLPVLAGLSDGVYGKPNNLKGREKLSPPPSQELLQSFRSKSFLEKHPSFTRTEEVCGLKAYVFRSEVNDNQNAMAWVEKSYSPKTGINPLRTVTHFRDGSEVRIEATKVEFKDIPQNINDDLKALPVMEKRPNKSQ